MRLFRHYGPDIVSPQSQDARERIADEDPAVIDMRSWYAEEYRKIDQDGGDGLVFSWVGLQTCLAQLHVADYEGKRHVIAAHSLARQASAGNLNWLYRQAGLQHQSISGQMGRKIKQLFVTQQETTASAAVASIVMHTRSAPALWMALEMRAYGLTSEHMRLWRYRDQMRSERTGFIDPGRLTVTVPPTGPVTFVRQGSLEVESVEPKPVDPGFCSGIAGSLTKL